MEQFTSIPELLVFMEPSLRVGDILDSRYFQGRKKRSYNPLSEYSYADFYVHF